MKNIFKILIGVSILFLIILGSVYAADLSDVQLPTDFKSIVFLEKFIPYDEQIL